MALSPSLTISSISATLTGSATNISDTTVYGGLNPDRNTLAVYLLAMKVTEGSISEGLTEAALVVEVYNPLTATTWVVQNTIDGYQKFIHLIIPIFDSGAIYNPYDVAVEDGIIYQYTGTGTSQGIIPTESVDWVVRTAEELYAIMDTATEPANLIITILGTVLTYAAQQCLGTIAPQHARENCGGCPGNLGLKEKFDNLWLLIFNAGIASSRQKYIEGERFMRSAELYCDC